MKAVLVIDMPKTCYDCKYCRFDARRYNFRGCVLTDTEVQDGTIDICKEVHSCCPLKPMPDPKPMTKADHTYNPWEDTYRCGWNACLKEIEK